MGGGDFCGCKSLDPLSMFPTDLGSSRATEWIATQCASIAKPLAISSMASLTRSVATASRTRRLAKIWLSRVSHLVIVPGEPGTEELVVDSVPAAQCQVLPVVAPSMPATTPQKKVPVLCHGSLYSRT